MLTGWLRSTGIVLLAVLSLTGRTVSVGPPVPTSVTGQWIHSGSVTINGSNFGTKAAATPVVWDNSSSTSITQKWNGGWPNRSSNATYNIAYRAPIRGITPPHQRVGKYLAGAHAENNGYDAGYNVMVWKNRTISFPSFTYASWYQRSDDAWSFGGDDNYKTYDWSIGSSPYDLPNNWYAEYNPRPTSRTSSCAWHLNDDNGSLSNPSSWWGGNCTNPMKGQWAKVEIFIKWSPNSDGFVRIYDNGNEVLSYTGPTDRMGGTSRSEAIGGYARRSGQTNNWRYFTDIYLDYSLAHVVIGNASTIAASTRRDVQIPTSWSDSSITVNVNLGAFFEGQSAYLYIYDASGLVNSAGLPIVLGATSGAPSAPANLRIVP